METPRQALIILLYHPYPPLMIYPLHPGITNEAGVARPIPEVQPTAGLRPNIHGPVCA